MKRIQFSVTYPERFVHPLHRRVVEHPSISRAELLMWSPTADATTLFWFDSDHDATERVVQAIDSLLVSNLVEGAEGTYAFLQQSEFELPTPVLDAVSGSRVIFLPPVVFSESGTVRFEAAGETTALSSFHDTLDDLGDLTIEAVHTFERTDSPARLTERQQAALDAGVAVGYYEVPRDGSIADIAAVLDCSKSTAGELVRKAETAVIREHVEGGARR